MSSSEGTLTWIRTRVESVLRTLLLLGQAERSGVGRGVVATSGGGDSGASSSESGVMAKLPDPVSAARRARPLRCCVHPPSEMVAVVCLESSDVGSSEVVGVNVR